jgi:uncharacterized protein
MERFSYTARMTNEFDPLRLHVAAFAQAAASFSGSEPLSRFDRLMNEAGGQGGQIAVAYGLEGSIRLDPAGHEEPWLHLSASTTLTQVCQRCLGGVGVELQFERDFRFVATEALAEIEDEESDEDVLVLSKAFNLLDLIEDELLMAMPAVPKHDICPTPVKLDVLDPGFVAEPLERANPFAALQALKKTGRG